MTLTEMSWPKGGTLYIFRVHSIRSQNRVIDWQGLVWYDGNE